MNDAAKAGQPLAASKMISLGVENRRNVLDQLSPPARSRLRPRPP